MTIAAILLAAGRSTRFGPDDKLAVLLDGIPLGLHAARVLSALPLGLRFVVTGPSPGLNWPGLEMVTNTRPEDGMGHSIALGVAAARQKGANAVLIALADMPFVPLTHFERILAHPVETETCVASGSGVRRMVPALFGSGWFDTLEALRGDRGARELLEHATLVPATERELRDIDNREDWLNAAADALGHNDG
jgi:molybdenum cofactor cytidylyltransferase